MDTQVFWSSKLFQSIRGSFKYHNQMFGNNQVLAILILALLAHIPKAILTVYNLQALDNNDQSLLDISYSIANYGFAPFGKTIIGRLVNAPNFGEECTAESEPGVEYQNTFMLISRGECEFVTKTLNAQRLGAQLAIIMDDKQHSNSVIMADNGYGYKVTIPSIFINYQNGQKLKKLLEDNQDEQRPDIMMKITFENQKTSQVNVTLYLQANNRHAYRFVEGFKKYYHLIRDHVNLNLVYSTVKCPDCPPADCYNSQEYCAFNFVHQESASGKMILDQQVREQLMYELHPEDWWKYMQYVGDECGVIAEYEQCQANGLKKLGLDASDLKSKFDKTFDSKGQNRFLRANREQLASAGVTRYPTVTLNRVRVKGTLHPEFVFDDICNTLKSPPSECSKYVETTILQQNVSLPWATLILVVSLGVGIFSLIFCFYRRYMKRKISQEMQGRVDDMVSKYIQFYSERNK